MGLYVSIKGRFQREYTGAIGFVNHTEPMVNGWQIFFRNSLKVLGVGFRHATSDASYT